MREVRAEQITQAVRELAIEANTRLGDDVVRVLKDSVEREESPVGRDILLHLLHNAEVAREQSVPLCQDTGLAVVFVDIGQDVHVSGGSVRDAVNEGVRQGYRDGYLRASVKDFLTGENTGDNTPAVVHFDIVPGERIRITLMVKGGGSENMSRVTSLTPAEGIEGIRRLVVERVREAGGNPCPPTVVGVGVAGTQELAALLAKRALLRPLGQPNPEPSLAALEADLLKRINRLGIGPQGLGGRITSLGVHVCVAPHHIAGMAVAINLQCHSLRHREVEL